MTRDRILVTGANGNLGRALLRELGPTRALAATRAGRATPSGFEGVSLEADGGVSADVLARCRTVINAAGCVTGDTAQLTAANVKLPMALARAASTAGVQKLVQVSSFSVFGAADRIDESSAEHPINEYGRSKMAAELELSALARDGLAIECVRLPFMFSAEKPALMGSLLKLATRLRLLPVASARPFQRSMITYSDAARQLIACGEHRTSGNACVADPQLFDYALLQRVVEEEAAIRVFLLPLHPLIVSGLDKVVPALSRRLLHSSVLSPRLNRAGTEPLGLEDELRQLVRASCGRRERRNAPLV